MDTLVDRQTSGGFSSLSDKIFVPQNLLIYSISSS